MVTTFARTGFSARTRQIGVGWRDDTLAAGHENFHVKKLLSH
jgi:hypothetical protein